MTLIPGVLQLHKGTNLSPWGSSIHHDGGQVEMGAEL